MTKQTLIRRIGERVRSIFTKDPTAVTNRVEERNSKIDYRDIVGYGDFDEHYGDRLHYIGRVIEQQNRTAIFAGGLMGFQRLASLAARGRVRKAISEIEKKTRSFDLGFECESREFYDGSWCTIPKSKKGMNGDCGRSLDYIDICLFGARLAESAERYQEALQLYQRAYHVLRNRESNVGFGSQIFGIYLPNGYAKEYQNREKMLRSGIKRVVKKSGGDRK